MSSAYLALHLLVKLGQARLSHEGVHLCDPAYATSVAQWDQALARKFPVRLFLTVSIGTMLGGGAVDLRPLLSLGDHMRHIISVLGVIGISAALIASPVRALEPDQLPPSYTLGLNAGTAHMGFADGAGGVLRNRSTASALGADTIPTFDSYF